jgi:hypothetical protein
MTHAARSVYVFGIYLVVLGGVLMGTPNTLLAMVGQPATTEPWIHVLGIPVMGMGLTYLAMAGSGQTAFLQVSVWGRLFALAAFVALTVVGIVPPIVAAFGLLDAAGAAWTHATLRAATT